MGQIKIIIVLLLSIVLQWSLRNVGEVFAYVNFPLIIVVYAALQRNSINALIYGTVAGLSIDSLSGGLMGSTAFVYTIIAYIVSEVSRRIYLDNILLRIPVIAGSSTVFSILYFAVHKLFERELRGDIVVNVLYSLLGTTIAGTILYLIFDGLLSEARKTRRRDFFVSKRSTRRRNPIRLGRRP